MIEFINARTGELIATGDNDGAASAVAKRRPESDTVKRWEACYWLYAAMLARENNDDIYIRWESGAGSEAKPDTLVTLQEALS